MLTSADLQKIDKLLDKKLDKKLDQKLKPIKKDIKTIISFFDKEIIGLHRRVKRVEDHLELPPLTS